MGRGASELANPLYGARDATTRSVPQPPTDAELLEKAIKRPENAPYHFTPFGGNVRGLNFIIDSAKLVAPSTWKEFRGHIAVDPVKKEYVGITAYGASGELGHSGSIKYRGPDLDQAIKEVNKVLKSKQRKKSDAYQPDDGTDESLLDRLSFERALRPR